MSLSTTWVHAFFPPVRTQIPQHCWKKNKHREKCEAHGQKGRRHVSAWLFFPRDQTNGVLRWKATSRCVPKVEAWVDHRTSLLSRGPHPHHCPLPNHHICFISTVARHTKQWWRPGQWGPAVTAGGLCSVIWSPLGNTRICHGVLLATEEPACPAPLRFRWWVRLPLPNPVETYHGPGASAKWAATHREGGRSWLKAIISRGGSVRWWVLRTV